MFGRLRRWLRAWPLSGPLRLRERPAYEGFLIDPDGPSSVDADALPELDECTYIGCRSNDDIDKGKA